MARAADRLRVLFLCTGNSCRSQMAEGWARTLRPDTIEAYSAGTDPHGLNPRAVQAMAEVGVDISRATSKRPGDLGLSFDVVVTVCDSAHESCPVLPGARVVHAGFEDPPRLAKTAKTEEEAMVHYRRVRDQIRAFIESLPGALAQPGPQHQGSSPMKTPPNDSCCGPGCCGDTPPAAREVDHDEVRGQVRDGYATIARSGSWSAAQREAEAQSGCCGGSSGGGCCGPAALSPEQLAVAIGYSRGELAASPDGANMGLSCGNPTVIASLKPGEIVLDLGAGGGFDCFIAGPKVGATGRVIGVDMTPEMLSKARRNIASYTKQTGLSNIEFRLGEIENLPVADASVDVVISNCVLNLSPEKARVWREIARVLKPGGRVAVSDLALLRPLPDSVKDDVESLVGCVAGAALVEETHAMAVAAGLSGIVLAAKPEYIDAMTDGQDPLYRKILDRLPGGSKPSDYITSLDVSAVKR